MKSAAIPALLLVVLGAVSSCAQTQPSQARDIRLDAGKPTVYLTFHKAGKVKPGYEFEGNERVWLRFHNNTNATLSLPTIDAGCGTEETRLLDGKVVLACRESVEIHARYQVQSLSQPKWKHGKRIEPPPPPAAEGSGTDVGGRALVPPGKTVIFSVPKAHLGKELVIYISFRYEWELGRTDEPWHRVGFAHDELPK
jgi:hypothetical protein